MAKSPNWTDEEIELLAVAYPYLGSCVELKEMFPHRTLEAITLKANRMGFKVTNNPRERMSNDDYVYMCKTTDFTPLEVYRGSTTPILHKCNICGNEWNARPQHILKEGAKCPVCSKEHLHNTTLQKVTKVLKDSGLEQLSEYTGALDPIVLKHTFCGNIWTTRYTHIQQGSGCPKCNRGFGYKYGSTIPENAYLYVIEIIFTNGEHCLKIGITSRLDYSIRFEEISSSIRTDNLIVFKPLFVLKSNGRTILDIEHTLLSSEHKYTSKYLFNGCKETYSLSVIKIINKIIEENNVEIVYQHPDS